MTDEIGKPVAIAVIVFCGVAAAGLKGLDLLDWWSERKLR